MLKYPVKKYYPYYNNYNNYTKGRWSSNISNISLDLNSNITETIYGNILLCENPAQSPNTVSQEYTVKNVEMQLKIDSPNSVQFSNLTLYVMYAPQGMTITDNYWKQHPEYIMTCKFIGSPEPVDDIYRNSVTVKTRLARKLNTGDAIILYAVGNHRNDNNSNQSVYIRGIVRWWTKAN